MSPKLLNIFLLMFSGVIYFFFINPVYTGVGSLWTPEKGIIQLRTDKQRYTSTLDQVGTIVAQAGTLKKEYAGVTDEEKAKMQMMVPNSIDKVRLLSEITNIASQSGTTLDTLNVSDLKSYGDKAVGAYTVTFSIKATYPRFKEIMRNYETSLRLFSTESVAFSASEKETDPITFNVRMMTYYMK